MHEGVEHLSCHCEIWRYPKEVYKMTTDKDGKIVRVLPTEIVEYTNEGSQLIYSGPIDLTGIETDEQLADHMAKFVVSLNLAPQNNGLPADDFVEPFIYCFCDEHDESDAPVEEHQH